MPLKYNKISKQTKIIKYYIILDIEIHTYFWDTQYIKKFTKYENLTAFNFVTGFLL